MALIKRKEEVRPYLPIAYAGKVEHLPGFDAAEENYLLPILGSDLYEELVSAYAADTTTAVQKALLDKCRAVVVPFAYAANLPFIQTLLTDNGLVALEAEQTRKAFRWEYNNAINALTERGWAAQEALILFLERYSAAYPLWSDSPYRKDSFAIIRNGHELAASVVVQQPQRSYMLLKGIFATVEELYLKEQLGPDCYDSFIAAIRAGTLSQRERELLSLLKKATARLALSKAATELSIRFSDSGFTVIRGTLPDQNGENSAGESQLQRFSNEMSSVGQSLLEKALRLLNQYASPTEFSYYFYSDRYESPTASANSLDNKNRKGFFAAN